MHALDFDTDYVPNGASAHPSSPAELSEAPREDSTSPPSDKGLQALPSGAPSTHAPP